MLFVYTGSIADCSTQYCYLGLYSETHNTTTNSVTLHLHWVLYSRWLNADRWTYTWTLFSCMKDWRWVKLEKVQSGSSVGLHIPSYDSIQCPTLGQGSENRHQHPYPCSILFRGLWDHPVSILIDSHGCTFSQSLTCVNLSHILLTWCLTYTSGNSGCRVMAQIEECGCANAVFRGKPVGV